MILPPDDDLDGLTDSKLLTAEQREDFAARIRACALAVSVVRVRPASIDRRGLHRSNLWALRQAGVRLAPEPDYLLVDGYPIHRTPFPSLAVKKGDRVSRAVAAASIIAKVTRDRTMARLDREYPEFNFAENKGYGTSEHWEALDELGPTPVHRLSFNGVGQMSLFRSEPA